MIGDRRAVRPLDPAAIAAADAAVAAETGGRPLTMGPEDAALREKWMDAYVAAGGKVKVVGRRGSKPSDPCENCPCRPISRIALVSLSFKSDHGLLKDHDSDWDDGGARFPKPEWTPADQHPVSHTMKRKVALQVTIEVEPADACPETGSLVGTGPDGLEFRKDGVTFSAGQHTIDLESDGELPEKIQVFDFKIGWKTEGTSVQIAPAETKNTMYVTMGTPTTPPRRPGITHKRMLKAVLSTAPPASVDPHDIVEYVMSKWGEFNLDVVHDNAWELGDDAVDPATGALVGADCQTIVRFTENVIGMIGCPGKAEFIVVWAKVPTPARGEENLAFTPNVSDPKQWHNDFNPPEAAKEKWRATLEDGDLRHNRYEACLRFTHPESGPSAKKKYYAGGAGTHDNADEVITVFNALIWRNDDTGAKTGVIHTY